MNNIAISNGFSFYSRFNNFWLLSQSRAAIALSSGAPVCKKKKNLIRFHSRKSHVGDLEWNFQRFMSQQGLFIWFGVQ